MEVPPDGAVALTRTRTAGTVRVAWVSTALCLVVLALLGAAVWSDVAPLLRVDAAVSEAMYAGDGRAAGLDGLLEVLTAPGVSWVRYLVFLPVLLWLLLQRSWWTAAWLVTAVVLVGPLTTVLKEYVGRVRPAFDEGGARYESLSYPSGHSAGIAALVAVALVLAWPLLRARARRWSLVAGAGIVLLVGFTRMWLGVHYLSDVLGGWSFGLAWTLGTALLFGALPGGRAALR
ncbi:undecaprenyl-diphosphatase [Blastococcus colisei]|uniref:Undecaprenyl-diphosphatase n=1 Tax=Blastococcus colisei TaxID=1564162 RepID=A0A543PHT4_9ACTN|nr:phosphatase PAP2 family protein [Blastococcus colisei]TQN43651.1 undecaprenyl-diphosphatase [Blastococcus colisei]